MKQPLLSICIATYNRGSLIGETLDTIVPQLTGQVEIVVVDGASTDNTEEVVRHYAHKESRIRYFRLPKKGGVDHDYDLAVQNARGEMCWLFTDDDLLKPGAVDEVMKRIAKGYDLIIVNAEMRNRDLTHTYEDRRMHLEADREYAPSEFERFFVDAFDYLSFIGGVVIRRTLWMERNRERYMGTEFIHVGVIFQKPFAGSLFILAEPHIIIRYGNAQWVSRHFEIWMFRWPGMAWSFSGFSEGAMAKVSYREPWRKFRVLVYQRSVGNYSLGLYREYLATKPSGKVWRLCALLIARLPVSICIGACNIYFFLHGVRLPYPKGE